MSFAILPSTPLASAAMPPTMPWTADEHSMPWRPLAKERLITGADSVFKTIAERTRARRVEKRAIED
jgi:hypothetical protein